MAEVARYQLGETTVIVYDDAYVGKTKEDIDAVLRQAAAVAERYTRIPNMADLLHEKRGEDK